MYIQHRTDQILCGACVRQQPQLRNSRHGACEAAQTHYARRLPGISGQKVFIVPRRKFCQYGSGVISIGRMVAWPGSRVGGSVRGRQKKRDGQKIRMEAAASFSENYPLISAGGFLLEGEKEGRQGGSTLRSTTPKIALPRQKILGSKNGV